MVLLFVLMQREDLRDRLIRLAGSRDLHRTTVAMDDAAGRLSRYFVAQLALNSAFGLVVGIGLYLIGVPNPVLCGIVSALMRFVPYLGAFISALLPMVLAAAFEPGWNMTIATAILFLILEPLTGQVIEPMLYGQSTASRPPPCWSRPCSGHGSGGRWGSCSRRRSPSASWCSGAMPSISNSSTCCSVTGPH